MADKEQSFNLPLSGKLVTSSDPLLLQEGDFQSLKNMRYTDKGIRGIQGNSKINTAATSYPVVVNGHYFRKDEPLTDAIVLQTTSGGNSRLVVSATPNNVPNQDTFSTLTELNVNTRTEFSNAPVGAMVACNGDTNYIWGGAETPVGKFVVFDPAGSYSYDYSDVVTNTLTDAANVATLARVAGSIDANTVLLLHMDNSWTDSASGAKTITNVAGNAGFNPTIYKFGNYSGGFNGTNSYLTTPDHADFDFSGGTWTIDCWIYPLSYAASNRTIYYQQSDANNDFQFYVSTTGALTLTIRAGGSTVVTLASAANAIALSTWQHVAAVENGNNYYLFINGVLVATVTDTDRAGNYTGVVNIAGKGAAQFFLGEIDEFRVSNTFRWINQFSPPITAYGSTYQSSIYLMTTRALQGVKFYVGTANASAATVSAAVWIGNGMGNLTVSSDSTAVGGKTLAQTGTISFGNTFGTAQLRYADNTVGYYYQITFDSIDAGVTISYCTVDAPIQGITDIWDGAERPAAAFYKYTSTYSDLIVNVSVREYTSLSSLTYAQAGGLTSSQYLYFGCSDRLMGIRWILPDASYVNTTASTIMSIDYWNGTSFVSVGAVSDGTQTGGVSFGQSGVTYWSPPSANAEFPVSINFSDKWFYYRVRFNQTLSADVRIDYITGIPAPVVLSPYAFPVTWQNRLFLLNEKTQHKNRAIGSAYNTNCSFNGDDSINFDFGGSEALICGATMFSRFSSSLYDNLVVMKRNSTYLVDGYSNSQTTSGSASGQFRIYTVSPTIGCIAPGTLKSCDMGYTIGQGITKHVLIWQSARGIEVFDGNALMELSRDISDFFDPTSANYITEAAVATFTAFYDEKNYEYHWLCATGGSSDINREMVYDLRRRKWFEIDRDTGNRLVCGFTVQDPSANAYVYGATASGYVQRLENGTKFDNTSKTYSFRTPDTPFAKDLMQESLIRRMVLVAKAKNVTTQMVSINCYVNSETTGQAIAPAVPISSPVARIVGVGTGTKNTTMRSQGGLRGVTHSFEFILSEGTETIGFEPLLFCGTFKVEREVM